MRAIQADFYGGPEVLKVVELPVPQPGEGEVLVKVRAAGINPVDWKSRAGHLSGAFGDEGPWIWGWDVAGTVEAVGPGTVEFRPGDEVFGMPLFPRLADAYAEYVVSPAAHLAAKPAALGFEEAGALPLAGLTALQVIDLAKVKAGDRVLVTAAAGGVGHLAVQLAKARGAYVLGTARSVNHDFLRSIGVDEPIDYSTTDVAAAARDLDMVFDVFDDESLLGSVKPGGAFVRITTDVPPALAEAAEKAGVRAARHVVTTDGPGLARLAELAADGRLRVEVARAFPLEDAAAAHELLESGHTRGKIVLIP